MSILENLSDLAHELRCAAGTVLTILGSRLEADARARVECGPQWLTEFKEQRDSLEPQCACGAGYTSAAECPWCREVGDCICWVGHGDCGGCSGVVGISHEPACGWQWDPSCPQHGDGLKASAASALAADPSPTVPNAHSVVGGEGPGGASDIPQSAPPGQPRGEDPNRLMGRYTRLLADQTSPAPLVVAGESPREEDEQPSLGEPRRNLADLLYEAAVGLEWFVGLDGSRPPVERCQRLIAELRDHAGSIEANNPTKPVSHEDLAAHLIGAAIQANTGHVDVLVEAFASSLLTDFNITKK